jgi:hypothetical protein
MALEEFEREQLSERDKGIIRMRSITNYGMGVFMIFAGCFFMFPIKLTANYINQYDPVLIRYLPQYAGCMELSGYTGGIKKITLEINEQYPDKVSVNFFYNL